jgi:LPXTG-motif cell wall-anchored protein
VWFEWTKNGVAGTPISATLQFLATTNGPASTSGGITTESFSQVSMVFSTGTGASKVNLLTVTSSINPSSAGTLAGQAGGNAAALFGSGKGGQFITFSSAVMSSVDGVKNGDYSLAFSSLQPAFLTASDGILQSFKAAGSGTFGAPVPEASTMISFGVLLLGGAILVFARRKQNSGSAA